MTMSDIFMTSQPVGSKPAVGSNRGSAVRLAADWLCLAATPAFAVMALLAALDDGHTDILCAVKQHLSPLGGMVPMYVLMSAFHLAPWLKLIAHWQSGARTAGLS